MTIALVSGPGERLQDGGAPGSATPDSPEQEDRWGFEEGDEIAPGLYALRTLGGGTRFEVYLAWKEDLHCLVVAKILRPKSVNSNSSRGGLDREARLLEHLQHPGLLRCFDAVLNGPRPHLVLEFLEGPRLSTLLRRFGALAPEQLASLVLQLCSVLHYMGVRETLHLDVKPQNIIMGPVPRLIDLSIARTVEEGRRLEDPVGTDAYMAPEQCDPQSAGGVGPAADIWGLGVTFYEAASGSRPFPRADDDSTPMNPWPQLEHAPAPLTDRVPPVLAQLILACLETLPEDRPEAADLAGSLEEVVATLPRRPVLGRLRPKLG